MTVVKIKIDQPQSAQRSQSYLLFILCDLDSVWKICSWHFHPNMSYIRPDSFYLLHPCSRLWLYSFVFF